LDYAIPLLPPASQVDYPRVGTGRVEQLAAAESTEPLHLLFQVFLI
jgi:hypothetical protein